MITRNKEKLRKTWGKRGNLDETRGNPKDKMGKY